MHPRQRAEIDQTIEELRALRAETQRIVDGMDP
jgi:hypothetical protein